MNTIFIEDWGLTARAALSERDFDRFAGLFVKAVIGEEPSEEDKKTKAYKVFSAMRVREKIEKSNEKYEKRIEKTKQNSEKNEKKNTIQSIENQIDEVANTKPKTKPNTITNTTLKETSKEKAARPHVPQFQKPTIEELTQLCQERGYQFNPAHFIDHYESNGWMVGRTKMKDWRAAAANWERRRKTEYQNISNYGRKQQSNGNQAGFCGNYPADQETL